MDCGECGTVYQNPRVRDEDLPLCYPSRYFTHDINPEGSGRPAPHDSVRGRLKRAVRRAADGVHDGGLSLPWRVVGRLLAVHPGLRRRARLGLIDPLAPPPGRRARCLEVGPGHGFDLWCLRSLGWEAFGLEADPVAAGNARMRSGCEVRVGTLVSTDYAPGQFDLVYLNHVAEHLPDPRASFERCLELLGPGGRLVLVYPNPGALTARLYGRHSLVWDPPRHLVLPPLKTMTALLERCGFGGLRARTSAWRAPVNCGAARRLSRPRRTGPVPTKGAAVDRLFWILEASLVALRVPVGEEIVAVADKPAGSAHAAHAPERGYTSKR